MLDKPSQFDLVSVYSRTISHLGKLLSYVFILTGVISVSVAGQRQHHQQPPGSQQQLFNKPAVPPGAQAVSGSRQQAVTAAGHQRVPAAAAAAVPAAEEIPDSTTSGVSNVISIPDTEPLAGMMQLPTIYQCVCMKST